MVDIQLKVREILELLLNTYKLNEAELSRQTGISPATIHRLMSGATPDMRTSTLRPIAKFFNITIGQLLGDEPFPIQNEPSSPRVITKLPLIPWDQAIEWQKLVDRYTPSNWTYWVTTSVNLSKNSYALSVESRNLPLPFAYKTVLMVDPETVLEDGKYVIAYKISDQSTTIKKLWLEGKERWLLPLNDKINAILYDNDFTLCGVVMQANIPL